MKTQLKKGNDQGSAMVLVIIFITVFGLWLASSLMVVQVGATEISKGKSKIAKRSEVSDAIAWTLSQANSSNGGTVGTNLNTDGNCGLGTYPSDLIEVECVPDLDSGMTVPLDTLILMATNSGTGQIQYGLDLRGSSANSNSLLKLQSGIRSVGGKFNLNSKITTQIDGVVRVPVGSSCPVELGARDCLVGSNDLNLESSNYWKSILSGIDKPSSSLAYSSPSSFPNCKVDWANVTNGQYPLTLNPGTYNDQIVGYLNEITNPSFTYSETVTVTTTKGNKVTTSESVTVTTLTSFAGMQNALGETCFAKGFVQPSNATVTIVMRPGVYYFQGSSASKEAKWIINEASIRVENQRVTASQADGRCYEQVSDLDSALSSSPKGVQLQFGANARLQLNDGSLRTCPNPYTLRPRISFVGINSSSRSLSTIYSDFNSKTNIIDISPAQNASPEFGFVSSGMVFAPTAIVNVNLANKQSNLISFESGLVVWSFVLNTTASSDSSLLSVKPPRKNNGNRTFKIIIKDKSSGRVLTTKKVEIIDEYGQKLNSGFRLSDG